MLGDETDMTQKPDDGAYVKVYTCIKGAHLL